MAYYQCFLWVLLGISAGILTLRYLLKVDKCLTLNDLILFIIMVFFGPISLFIYLIFNPFIKLNFIIYRKKD